MKKGIMLAVVVFLSTAVLAQAQEGDLSGYVDVTYRSASTWYGIDRFPGAHGEGATHTRLSLDLYDTGLGFDVEWIRANTGAVNPGYSFENLEELNFTLTYSNSCLEYETYATNYTIGWRYYEYPDNPSDLIDAQEMFASLSWPEICPAGVVPSYTLVRLWKSESGHPSSLPATTTNDISGWIHIAGLGYDMSVEDLLPDLPEQILHLSAAFVWNDGACAAGVDHDFSHAVLGASTDFDLGNNLTLTPGAYWQMTSEDTVNTQHDLLWASLGLKYSF